MLRAFRELGFEVFEITGTAKQRKQKIKELGRLLRRGEKFEFLYSESSTMPTALVDPGKRVPPLPLHYPLRPFLDRRLFAMCRRAGVATGLFYRDVYWQFQEKAEGRSLFGRLEDWLVRSLYRWDIHVINRFLDVLFVPSLEMASRIPGLSAPEVLALPPAGDPTQWAGRGVPRSNALELIYVGSLGRHYQVGLVADAVNAVADVDLTLVVPRAQESELEVQFADGALRGVAVVHTAQSGLKSLYAVSDIGMLYVEPSDYRTFAVPAKLYEYAAAGLPVIASSGTLAGEIIEKEGIGWAVPYQKGELETLLRKLQSGPSQVAARARAATEWAENNTWESRAESAALALTDAS